MKKEELVKYKKDVLDAMYQLTVDMNKPYILMGKKVYTANEVIREIDGLTDFGMKMIRSWVKLQEYIKSKK